MRCARVGSIVLSFAFLLLTAYWCFDHASICGTYITNGNNGRRSPQLLRALVWMLLRRRMRWKRLVELVWVRLLTMREHLSRGGVGALICPVAVVLGSGEY